MLPTIIPSKGVDPYHFGKTNAGTSIGNAIKKVASVSATANKIQETAAAETAAQKAAQAQKRKAARNVKKADATIGGLQKINEISKTAYPSTPVTGSPKARAQKGVLSRQMKPTAGNKRPAPQGSTTAVFQAPGEPAPNAAVKAVAASRKRARQVAPKTETSLTIKPL